MLGIGDWIVIVVYLLAMLAVGFIAKKQINTAEDYMLGGKGFNKFALTGTILATMVGSGMTMGAVGSSYTSGAEGTILWMYTGFSLGLIIISLFSKKMRASGAKSTAEIVAKAFGKKARLTVAIMVVVYAVALVAINIAGLRTVITYASGGQISVLGGTVIAAAIAIVFTALGGFVSVVWTDAAQLVVMFLGVFVLGPIIGIHYADGIDNVVSTYAAEGLSFSNPLVNGVSSGLIGFALSYFLASPGDPTMPQRVLAANSDGTAKLSFTASGLMGFYIGIALLLLGGAAHVLIPGLESSDQALPALILNYYPPVIKGVAIVGIVAAVISSFDSFLVLASTNIMYDIVASISGKMDNDKLKKAMPIATIVLGILGIVIALFITSLLGYLTVVFSMIGSALFPVTVAALFFRKYVSKISAAISVIVGGIVPLVLFFTKGYDVLLGDPVFWGVICSTGVIVIGSLILKDKPKSNDWSEPEYTGTNI